MLIKIPYGQAYFEKVLTEGYHYVDRTHYIEYLENVGESNIAFLRPRRFGKSLFVNMLEDYYNIKKKEKFEKIFGSTYIGKNPTPLRNTYMILGFDFSGILTETEAKARETFNLNVKLSLSSFIKAYFGAESSSILETLEKEAEAGSMINAVFSFVQSQNCTEKIYITIDEYDHFANELISFSLEVFKDAVSRNGWVRKFYETIKTAVGNGIVDRIFITGVSPITLDSLTSGFNIVKQLSSDPQLHDMMGFTKSEVETIMLGVGVPPENLETIMSSVTYWYNGYLFSDECTQRLYNPDMVLYFASEYRSRQKPPRKMLDINVMSDYTKIKRLFNIGHQEAERKHILEALLQNNEVTAAPTDQFTFEKQFDNKDFINLLYYMGALTIKGEDVGYTIFQIPNNVIKQLYFEYFSEVLMTEIGMNRDALEYEKAILSMIKENNIAPLVKIVATILSRLSNRDSVGFGEKHLKNFFVTILMFSEAYYIHSELEIRKGYSDIFIERSPRYDIPFQFLIELKYYTKSKYNKLKRKKKDGSPSDWSIEVQNAQNQLDEYAKNAYFQNQRGLKPWLIMFASDVPVVVEQR